MKKFANSICFMLMLVLTTLLSSCSGSTGAKQSAAVSDCNPNINEIIGIDETDQSPAAIARMPQVVNAEYGYQDNHILSVSCINDNKMLIVHYDPDFVCCLTPHSTCERNGNKIIINDWDSGSNPCDCLCPRKTDVTLSEVPYGEYTFSVRYDNKELHTAVVDFTATTDTVIVFNR